MGMAWITEPSVSIGSVGIPNWVWLVIALVVVILLIVIIVVAVSCKNKKTKDIQSAPTCGIERDTQPEELPAAEEVKAEADPVAEEVEETPVTQNKEVAKPAAKEEIMEENKTESKPKLVEKSATATKKTYHISLRKSDGMWQVKAAGAEKAIKLFKTQAEAIEYCKPLAENQDANIMIHKKDGSFRKLTY